MRVLFYTLALIGTVGCGGGDDDKSATGGATGTGGAGASGGKGGSGGTGGSRPGGAGGTPIPTCNSSTRGAPAGFHVAVNGSASGDGSATAPWDLPTAFAHPSVVKPGDTLFLHGGVYAGGFVAKLIGTSDAPIVVKSYPGEWAVLDGATSTEPGLQIYKQAAIFRDFEVTNSNPDRKTDRPSGIYVEGQNIKLVNLVVHDVGTGVICNSASAQNAELAPELEVYGTLLFDNGWDDVDRSHGHNLYLQNRDGTKHIVDNVIFNAFGFGIHAYSDTDTYWAQGYEIRGNAWFQNGTASTVVEPGGVADSKLYDDCMVGHNGTHPVARVELRENYGYAKNSDERDVRMGWNAPNEDATLSDNYIVGQTIFQPSWASVEMTGNTFFGSVTGIDTTQFANNTYLTARPTGAKVVVRPYEYEPGRAHVIVYNWDLASTVSVDVGSAVATGSKFELRNAQDPFAAPVLTGTFDGKPLVVPMDVLSVAQPIGAPNAIADSEKTGKEFNVFLLQSSCE